MTSLESIVRGVVLGALRRLRGWTGLQLADAVGTTEAMISHYESGAKELSLERFFEYGRKMGYSLRRLHAALFGLELSAPELADAIAASPFGTARLKVDLAAGGPPLRGLARDLERRREEEALGRRQVAEVAGLVTSRAADRVLVRSDVRRRVRRERREAEALCRRLVRLKESQQAAWVASDPVFQGWAVIERLAEMSATAASSSPARARQLAGWAKASAEASPETPDKPRSVGYAGFFYGNALRVSSELFGADSEVALAWEQWKRGEVPGAPPFARWRPYDLEASLRIDQGLWAAAVECSDIAFELGPPSARPRILLKKASGLQYAGTPASALPVLAQAVELIDADRDPYLAQIAHFTFAHCLFDLGRFTEAASQLTAARALAAACERELDLARCDWLGARIAAAQGEREHALGAFARARATFAAHDIAHDCAAIGLHESMVLLEAGEIERAKRTAAGVAWTFVNQGIAREGREALKVFFQAVQLEAATIDLAQWALGELRPAPPDREDL
jgi:transcriptional regulator with XRE-family HTH domain